MGPFFFCSFSGTILNRTSVRPFVFYTPALLHGKGTDPDAATESLPFDYTHTYHIPHLLTNSQDDIFPLQTDNSHRSLPSPTGRVDDVMNPTVTSRCLIENLSTRRNPVRLTFE